LLHEGEVCKKVSTEYKYKNRGWLLVVAKVTGLNRYKP